MGHSGDPCDVCNSWPICDCNEEGVLEEVDIYYYSRKGLDSNSFNPNVHWPLTIEKLEFDRNGIRFVRLFFTGDARE